MSSDVFGVEAQPIGDASTSIMCTHKELPAPKMTHGLDLVQRHCAERVIEAAISVGRTARIPVSSQIRYVDRLWTLPVQSANPHPDAVQQSALEPDCE